MTQDHSNKKAHQMTLEEYNKVKEKRAQSKLKLHFPLMVKFFFIFPIVYFLFLLLYFLFYIRFSVEH